MQSGEWTCDRSPRDEYLVAYQKHHHRGIHVWEVRCSAHHNNTIQGLVRYLIEVLVWKTLFSVWQSNVNFVVNAVIIANYFLLCSLYILPWPLKWWNSNSHSCVCLQMFGYCWWNYSFANIIMPLPLIGGTLSDDAFWRLSVCHLHRA